MDRRSFLQTLGMGTACLTLQRGSALAEDRKPRIAITMDDPRAVSALGHTAAEVNRQILEALRKHEIRATLFVCGMRVDDAVGHRLIAKWSDAGHTLGNHSYSHWFLHSDKVTLGAYCDDIARNEPVISGFPTFRRIFRYPFFKEGDTEEKRDGVRKFLAERKYTIGRATIDASDWAIESRMQARLKQDPNADLGLYRDFYLQHIWERATYYDDLSIRVLGRRPLHTLLVHYNLLNAMFLGDLLTMFRQRGWQPVDADRAYQDPVYAEQPKILPAGESLIWALAKQSGQFERVLRYPGEDDVYENPKMDRLKL